jgi:L-ascorbate metabolism protein UlaG (beta-lactamase superfamily)
MKVTRRGLFASVTGLLAVIGTGWATRSSASVYYSGPVSDHFDGVRFFDPNGAAPKKFTDLLRWWSAGGRQKWPDWHPSPHADTPPERVNGMDWRISYVGHATILIQTAGLNILLDPVWSERASPFTFAGPKRRNAPGIDFDKLPAIDAVLVSHCHYDHLDVDTLSRLARASNPRVITPLGNDTIMRAHDPAIRAEAHDWHDSVSLGGGVTVTLAPSRHWSARHFLDRNKALWAAFVIETPAGKIYHVADSGYGEGYHFKRACERYGPFRLAILPIGAYEPRWFMRDQHMNPEESVRAFTDCKAEYALAHHFGTFQLTDEAIDAPLTALKAACTAAELPAEKFRVLMPGQVWEL